jgi:hypothetical protein
MHEIEASAKSPTTPSRRAEERNPLRKGLDERRKRVAHTMAASDLTATLTAAESSLAEEK